MCVCVCVISESHLYFCSVCNIIMTTIIEMVYNSPVYNTLPANLATFPPWGGLQSLHCTYTGIYASCTAGWVFLQIQIPHRKLKFYIRLSGIKVIFFLNIFNTHK